MLHEHMTTRLATGSALMAGMVAMLLTPPLMAQEIPGPKVADVAPFNKPAVVLNARNCPTEYIDRDLIVSRPKIASDVRKCVAESFSMKSDIGLDIVPPGHATHPNCVIPKTFITEGSARYWPVCCPFKLPSGKMRYNCRYYAAGG